MIDETSAVYQIFLRNFTPEGSFRAAIPELGRIASMGFDWIYLTPVHPIGRAARKGALGSPYAISDYWRINPELGDIGDFRAFLAAAHSAGLKVMIDVVYNHTSPDSVLAEEHPEWFMIEGEAPAAARGELEIPAPGTRLGRKCADWSDVVDFDYSSSPALWMELISALIQWRDEGVDGFRCDVASLVPVDFWKQARQRVNQYDPGTRRDRYPLLWLAESVHPGFLKKLRERGLGAWSEPELHAVFDLSYDYDGWERLEEVWAGGRSAAHYLEYLYAQETLYPAAARKLRFLENHDQPRAAHRFPQRPRLEAWTVLAFFIPGVSLAYMGQEYALATRIGLFEKEPVDWSARDERFAAFFTRTLAACRDAKGRAPRFSWTELAPGIVLLERADGAAVRYQALVDTRGEGGKISLPRALRGRDMLSEAEVMLEGTIEVPENPLLIEVFA